MTDEDIAGVANNIVSSLKNQPVIIGLLVLNVIFVGVSYFEQQSSRQLRHDELMEIMRDCRPALNRSEREG